MTQDGTNYLPVPAPGDGEAVPRKQKRKQIHEELKRNEYHANWTPYPRFPVPTVEQVKEVIKDLQESLPNVNLKVLTKSSDFDQVIGPMHASDGFDVPGLFKILLSARTNNNNALLAEDNVCDAYPYVVDGKVIVTKVPNFYDIMTGSEEKLGIAMKAAGLFKVRATRLKKLLEKIYDKNCELTNRKLSKANKPGATDFVEGEGLSLAFLRSKTPEYVLNWFMKEVDGFGLKTTQCVLAFKMHFPTYTVDTHAMKGAQALGFVPTSVDIRSGSVQFDIACHMDFILQDEDRHTLHQGLWHHRQDCRKCTGFVRQGTSEWDLPENKCAIERHIKNWPTARSEKVASTKKRKAEEMADGDAEPAKKVKGLRHKRVYVEVDGIQKIQVGRRFVEDTYAFGQMNLIEAQLHGYEQKTFDIDGDFGSGEAKTGVRKKWVKVKRETETTKTVTTKITITEVGKDDDGDEADSDRDDISMDQDEDNRDIKAEEE